MGGGTESAGSAARDENGNISDSHRIFLTTSLCLLCSEALPAPPLGDARPLNTALTRLLTNRSHLVAQARLQPKSGEAPGAQGSSGQGEGKGGDGLEDARHAAPPVLLSWGNGAASRSCVPSHQASSRRLAVSSATTRQPHPQASRAKGRQNPAAP